MITIRKCVAEMTGYVPGESSDDASTVKLNQNENRYPPSPKVLEAMRRAAGSIQQYPDSTSSGLRRAAASVYGVGADEVMAANGSDEMLRILFQSFCDPGDGAVSFYPGYTYYATLAAMHDVRHRQINYEGEYRIPAKLELGTAKLVFLVNPNAPTGTVFPESEIRRLAESAPGSLVVIDEAYADFADVSAIPLIREYPNLFVVRTLSKSYALAGLRVGLGFGRAGILAEMEKVRDYYNLDRSAQAGAEAALLDQEWLRDTTGKITATRQRVSDAVRNLGPKVHDSGANFILIRFAGQEQAEAVFNFLRERKVLVRYFRSSGLSDCLRVSIGTDRDMDVFLVELENALRR